MDPEKPSCPTHGARAVGSIVGSNGIGKWYRCAYGDFRKFIEKGVNRMDIWEQIKNGFYNLGQIIDQGGEDMSARIEKEFYELGALIAQAKKENLRPEKKE